GATGTPWARTPNLDRLARTGVVFEQAYCAQPVCTPSRGTVLTGLYPHSHGATHNNVPLPADVPTIAELLRPHGYFCGYAGKWHLGNEYRPQHGFEWWASMEDGYVKEHTKEGFSTYHEWLVAKGYEPKDRAGDGSAVFSRGSAARLPEEAGKPAFLAEQAARFLDDHRAAHASQPFALYVNFLEPHMPFFGPRDGMYRAEEMELPATWYEAPDEGMPLRHRVRRDEYASEHNRHVDANDEAGWKRLVARYWGLTSLVDTYVGRILEHLEERGLAEETIVVYSTDHGDMMGEHRLIAKGVPYEGSARVPLVVRVPGVAPRRIETPVCQVDLLPTLMEALGHDAPAHAQGESLLGLMREGDGARGRPEEAQVVFEWSGAQGDLGADGHRYDPAVVGKAGAPQRTIRVGRWKLTVDVAGEHELYDLESDPLERRNLMWGDRLGRHAGAAEAVGDLWERLRGWQARTADGLELPAPEPWGTAT
ncbi:MAG TPA: sulfatase-like hydrolase/transferase, partial [Chloroflexota bacterium]|nr:sulfatase-like hydrolase/transferase [Chloroflexota bacterium]